MKNTVDISLSSPHIHDWRTSAKAAWICSATLGPVVAVSILFYGAAALTVWLASIFGALFAETLVAAFTKRLSLTDGSTVLTGLLIASAMPPGIPLYIPFSASLFAIIAVKIVFGGLGSNWMNPALGGIAFAYANWPVAMRRFKLPSAIDGLDGMTMATPLEFARNQAGAESVRIMDVFRNAGYPLTEIDSAITGFLNDSVFSHIGARLPEGYIDLMIGMKSGALGESALLLVLAGSILLLALGLIKVEIPLGMIAGFSLLSRIFGTGLPGEAMFTGDILFALSSGGFMLAAFYMATDPVTSPVDRRIAVLYGFGIGILAFAFRKWGANAEGIVYAILIMNIFVPSVERNRMPRFGDRRKAGTL